MRLIPLLIAVVCLSGLTGCSTCILTVNGACVSLRDRMKAERAWLKHWSLYNDVDYRWSFSNGFKAGYLDVSHGGDGAPPDLPPMHYWKSHYQKPKGRRKVVSWYDGFTHGVLAATYDNASIRHRIPNCGACTECSECTDCSECSACGAPAAVDTWGEELIIETPDQMGPVREEMEPPPPSMDVPPSPEGQQWRPTQEPDSQPRRPVEPYIEPELKGEPPATSQSGAQKPRRNAAPVSHQMPKPVKRQSIGMMRSTRPGSNGGPLPSSCQDCSDDKAQDAGAWHLPYVADR